MDFVHRSVDDGIAEVRIERGKVNALDDSLVKELSRMFAALAEGPRCARQHSHGHRQLLLVWLRYPQVPCLLEGGVHLLPQSVHRPLPGALLASEADHRGAQRTHGRRGLHAGHRVRHPDRGGGQGKDWLERDRVRVFDLRGQPCDASVLGRGAPRAGYPVRWQAVLCAGGTELGLIDAVVPDGQLLQTARQIAQQHAGKAPAAFRSIKSLLRKPVLEAMIAREGKSIEEFVEIWYSQETWEKLKDIKNSTA